MEIRGVSYPFTLGSNNKNSLPKQGGYCKRWININHDDWSAPVWKIALCKATLVDRSLGPKKYAYFATDIAVMTEYEDPKLNMVIYDLAPAKSVVFDTQIKPPQSIEIAYDWSVIGGLDIALIDTPNLVRNPLYPVLGIGGFLFAAQFLRNIISTPKDNL